jgi:hypothetical protein
MEGSDDGTFRGLPFSCRIKLNTFTNSCDCEGGNAQEVTLKNGWDMLFNKQKTRGQNDEIE